MLNFLKTFGFGILCVILLPVFVAILGIYAVYCLTMFLYVSFRSLISFFSGGKIFEELPEDIEALRIIRERKEKEELMQQTISNIYASAQFNAANIQQNINLTQPEKPENKEENNNDFVDKVN